MAQPQPQSHFAKIMFKNELVCTSEESLHQKTRRKKKKKKEEATFGCRYILNQIPASAGQIFLFL